MDSSHDLRHHGDAEVGADLVDFAVNVRRSAPPAWLADRLSSGIARLGSYPSRVDAIAAIAGAHQISPDCVLPTAGAAEAFTLLARAIPAESPVVIHPQFTEPEAALTAAGRHVERVELSAEYGFTWDAGQIPTAADLIVVGNPTNPTGVLHSPDDIRALVRPGRIVVVDEAFMDATAGEANSLAAEPLHGLIVVRSLTKTWGIAGLRAGYVVGDPRVISDLATAQPHWSVSSLALDAIAVCLSEQARAEAQSVIGEIVADRRYLAESPCDAEVSESLTRKRRLYSRIAAR